MEFLGGLVCLVIGLGGVAAAATRGIRVARILLGVGLLIEAGIVGTLWLDWGYSWVENSALELAMNRDIWLATPHALGLTVIAGLLYWGRRFSPWASVLSLSQALLFIPVLLGEEQEMDMSFLAVAPIVAMYASILAAFLFLGVACTVVPDRGTRWYRIAFGRRDDLIRSIEVLSEVGLSVRGPSTVFESGSAEGVLGLARIRLSSRPTLVPQAYGLRVEIEFDGDGRPGSLPDAPGFAQKESLDFVNGGVIYQGWSERNFAVSPRTLQDFVARLASGGSDGEPAFRT
jgi:hypothetical protein